MDRTTCSSSMSWSGPGNLTCHVVSRTAGNLSVFEDEVLIVLRIKNVFLILKLLLRWLGQIIVLCFMYKGNKIKQFSTWRSLLPLAVPVPVSVRVFPTRIQSLRQISDNSSYSCCSAWRINSSVKAQLRAIMMAYLLPNDVPQFSQPAFVSVPASCSW